MVPVNQGVYEDHLLFWSSGSLVFPEELLEKDRETGGSKMLTLFGSMILAPGEFPVARFASQNRILHTVVVYLAITQWTSCSSGTGFSCFENAFDTSEESNPYVFDKLFVYYALCISCIEAGYLFSWNSTCPGWPVVSGFGIAHIFVRDLSGWSIW